MRNPLIVLENTRRILSKGGSDSDVDTYVKSEGMSLDNISKIPIPKNISQIASVLKIGEDFGKALQSIPKSTLATVPPVGALGVMARHPEATAKILPIAGQITGEAIGALKGGSVGYKAGGSIGATIGESFAQAINMVRGTTITPQDAMREIVHTGKIATASELAFGPGGPGAVLIEKHIAPALSKLAEPILKKGRQGILELLQFSVGKENTQIDDMAELLQRGAKRVLSAKNLGNSIDISVVDKATKGLNLLREQAGTEYANIVNPLTKNKDLIGFTKPIIDGFSKVLKDVGLVDDTGKFIKGAFEDVKYKDRVEIVKRINQLKYITTKSGDKVIKTPRNTMKLSEMLATRRELDDLIKFTKQTESVTPRTTQFKSALKGLRNSINDELYKVGGDTFRNADAKFAEKISLFNDLQPALRTPDKAERSIEQIIKQARQSKIELLKQLDESLPKELKFMDDLFDFGVAQKFKSNAVNYYRAGMLSAIFGIGGFLKGGIPGTVAGIYAGHQIASPKGVGDVLKLLQETGRFMDKASAETGKRLAQTSPVLAREVSKVLGL